MRWSISWQPHADGNDKGICPERPFDATTIEGVQNVAYDIMRHGIKIARVTAEDAVDGMITYTDEYVKNGQGQNAYRKGDEPQI